MQEHDRRVTEAGGNVAVAARRLLDEVNGETHLDPRRVSIGGGDAEAKAGSDLEHSEISASQEKFA